MYLNHKYTNIDYTVNVEKHEGKRPLEKAASCKQCDNIKVRAIKIERGVIDWIYAAHNRVGNFSTS
jgi:hypothetical protein